MTEKDLKIRDQLNELHTLQKCIMHETKVLQDFISQKAVKDFFFDVRSKQTDQITKALIKFIGIVPNLTKGVKSFKGNYQTLPSFFDTVNEPLGQCGCKIEQYIHSIPLGPEQKLHTFVVTVLKHESDQYLRSVTMLPDKMTGGKISHYEDPQVLGGVTTYVKRYASKAILGLDADEDTDGRSKPANSAPWSQK